MTLLRHASFLAAVLAAVLAGTAAVLAPAGPVRAAEVSAWDGDANAQVRLIGGGPAETALTAGIEIKLAPGWHTYWRYPGDAGVPPRFDFSSSVNVASAEVLYPAPHRIVAGGAVSIGYEDSLVLPVKIVPREPGRPVMLNLKLDYAVCEKLCVPAQAQASLTLADGARPPNGALAAAIARLPVSRAPGEAGPGGLAVAALQRAGKEVTVDVTAPGGAVDLFVEGPDPAWALPVPEKIGGAPSGSQRFRFELDGLPPNTAADGAELRLTAVGADAAVDVRARLN